MSPRNGFDRFMVGLDIGRDLKLRPLNDSEWRCFVGGVLPIAAKSPIRGRLLIADRRADADDIAAQAGTKVTAARSALRKLRDLGIVLPDLEFECERVHDFEEWNPPPKKDATAAERQQRRRDRLKAERQAREQAEAGQERHGVTSRQTSRSSRRDGHGHVTGVTPTEVRRRSKKVSPGGGMGRSASARCSAAACAPAVTGQGQRLRWSGGAA